MAVPVITTLSSIIDFPIGETWIFQPAATNSPTSWAWTNLPPGITADTTTGAIRGTCIVQGVWIATATATNADGPSATLNMPVVVYQSLWSANASIEVLINAATGEVTSPQSLAIKTGTDLVFDVAFTKPATTGGAATLLTMNLGDLLVVITHPDTGEVIMSSDGSFVEVGDYLSRHYRILLSANSENLGTVFMANQKDTGTVIPAIAEFRFIHGVNFGGTMTPLQKISQNIPVTITRNLLGTP